MERNGEIVSMKQKALELYSSNHLVRTLIQNFTLSGIPVGALIDSIASEAYNKLHIERATTFFEELEKGKIELTQEIIQSDDFLFSLFATLKASLYTRQKEKVRFFARLFEKKFIESELSQADEYDDYLKILDELTFREIYMLYRLKQYESTAYPIDADEDDDQDDELQIAGRYWRDFSKEIQETFSIEYSEVTGLLTRAARTGCYVSITSMTLGYQGDLGKTTRVFEKLINMIEVKQEDFPYYKKITSNYM